MHIHKPHIYGKCPFPFLRRDNKAGKDVLGKHFDNWDLIKMVRNEPTGWTLGNETSYIMYPLISCLCCDRSLDNCNRCEHGTNWPYKVVFSSTMSVKRRTYQSFCSSYIHKSAFCNLIHIKQQRMLLLSCNGLGLVLTSVGRVNILDRFYQPLNKLCFGGNCQILVDISVTT